MFNKGSKTKSYIVSLAVVLLAISQAFVSPAVYLVANEASVSISSPVSIPNEIPSESPTPTPTPSPTTDPISTPVIIPPTDNGNGSNGGGSNGGGGGPAACNDTKPGSAPVLYSVSASGRNQVTLRWLEAKTPVSYYAITYSLVPGKQQYGNPYVGNANTTSYTVSHLSGGATYYFRVRAGNGCTPGNYSNEMSNKASGSFKQGPARGFIPNVLGTTKFNKPVTTPKATPVATSKPQVSNSGNNNFVNFLKSFINFFSN